MLPLPFLSATSANALISDLRPTTLTPSALQFINAILDELLVSIVTSARSINPAHFRTRGAPAVLADREDSLGALGRAAVGEAEVEIRSWYEGHPTANKRAGFPPGGEGIGLAGDAPTSAVFPIHEAVELMRLKAAMFSVRSDILSRSRATLDAFTGQGGEPAAPGGGVCRHGLHLRGAEANQGAREERGVHGWYGCACACAQPAHPGASCGTAWLCGACTALGGLGAFGCAPPCRSWATR